MVRLGIVGTGMMAGIIANSCSDAGVILHSVLSRTNASSEKFGLRHGVSPERRFSSYEQFFSDTELDVVYIATPTSEKEKLLRLCLQSNKHALIEKPFPSTSSMHDLLMNAEFRHLVWLDAAHYIHAPWYRKLDELIDEHVGVVNRIQASFLWPDQNTEQIKFDHTLEPYGVAGDLGWYPLRIISKFISPASISRMKSILLRGENDVITDMHVIGHTDTGTIFTASASYSGSVVQQRFEISGTKGRLIIDDFVMPYSGSFVYGTLKPDMRVHTEWGMIPLVNKKETVISMPEKQHISMLRNVAAFIESPHSPHLRMLQAECLNTLKLMRFTEDPPC